MRGKKYLVFLSVTNMVYYNDIASVEEIDLLLNFKIFKDLSVMQGLQHLKMIRR